MIRQLAQEEFIDAHEFIKKDNARNYFIRLGFESDKQVYDKIIGQYDDDNNLHAVLFRRKSGTLQFYAPGDFDVATFVDCIAQLESDTLISPASYCDRFLENSLFGKVKDGAIIAKLRKENSIRTDGDHTDIEVLRVQDLDEVISLYEKVFSGFSSKAVMEKRLISKRGRGVYIRKDGRIVAVVQSEFEDADSALIVGVATDPAYQGKGLATKCLKAMCSELQEKGLDLYLQYDNMEAGKIYEKLGFQPFDQVKHYIKK